ncbi:MAG: MATE family efflux transporter, partial [Tepidisphaeraceae bacterium]
VLLIAYSMLFKGTLVVAGGMRDEIVFVVLAMGIGVLVRLVSDASGAVLQSSGRIATDNLILAATEALWLGLTAAWITDDPDDVTRVAFAFALASAFQFVARFVAAEPVARLFNIEMKLDWRAGREMLGYGLMVTLAQLADYLYAPADFLLINQLLSPRDVATFSPAVQIDSGLLLLVSALAGVLLPKAALAHAAGDLTRVRAYYVRATLLSFVMLLAGAVTVWALSPWLLRLWLGSDLPATRAILPLVLVSTVVGGSGMVGRSILIGIGKVKPFTIAAIVAGVANVALGFVFVKFFGLGLRGIVFATMIVVVARAGLWLPWYVMRTLREKQG